MKVKQFFETEHLALWGINDLGENRAGRLSAAQRQMLELRLYRFASMGVILLGLLLLTVFIISIIVVYGMRQDVQAMLADGYVIAGLIIPPWLIMIFGYDGLCLLIDIRSGTVKRDCGVARLGTHRQPPLFQRRNSITLGKNRYFLNRNMSDLDEGEQVCIYYAPNTRVVTAVEAGTNG